MKNKGAERKGNKWCKRVNKIEEKSVFVSVHERGRETSRFILKEGEIEITICKRD